MFVSFKKPERLLDKAIASHQQGRLQEADALYRQILAENPNEPDALHMLGLLTFQFGNAAAGAEMIERSLVLAPNNPGAYSNLAEVKRVLGRFEEAANLCRRAISMAPTMSAAHVNLAMSIHQMGRPGEALPVALRAIEIAPREAPGYTAAGMALADLRRLPEAVRYLEEGLKINPNDAAVNSSLGLCYAQLEMYDKAKAALGRAVELNPNSPQLLLNMGCLYAQMERFPDAAHWFQRALEKKPDFQIALEHLSGTMIGLKRFEEAIEISKRALALNPNAIENYATMGEALMNLGRFDETIALMKQAGTIRPTPGVLQSLSNAYVRSGQPEIGLAELDKALALDPNNAVLHFNKAIILLLMGRLQEAWVEYEWRWQHPRMVGRTRRFNRPQWDGSKLDNKRVLFHAEQGMGDTIFFGRYATKAARERGVIPVMWVQSSMVELVKTIPGVGEVVGESGPLPEFDFHLPIMSLPRVFNTSLGTIPSEFPYVQSNPAKKEHWKSEFARRTDKFKVGLVWEGGHFQPENFLRSNSLGAYAPLADVSGVAFFGLQKGPAEKQCENPPAGMDFTNLGPFIKDFSDTAAILDNLDLLISIDTSVIHVAAALNKPVWMLLAWSPGHMWMFKREDTPWYPHVRIFRQPAFKDWATPVARVKVELEKLLKERKR